MLVCSEFLRLPTFEGAKTYISIAKSEKPNYSKTLDPIIHLKTRGINPKHAL